jgi:hypothetical protein
MRLKTFTALILMASAFISVTPIYAVEQSVTQKYAFVNKDPYENFRLSDVCQSLLHYKPENGKSCFSIVDKRIGGKTITENENLSLQYFSSELAKWCTLNEAKKSGENYVFKFTCIRAEDKKPISREATVDSFGKISKLHACNDHAYPGSCEEERQHRELETIKQKLYQDMKTIFV